MSENDQQQQATATLQIRRSRFPKVQPKIAGAAAGIARIRRLSGQVLNEQESLTTAQHQNNRLESKMIIT